MGERLRSFSTISRQFSSRRRRGDSTSAKGLRKASEVNLASNSAKEFEPIVPRLLQCNDPPTEEERAAIVNSIADVQAEFERLSHARYNPTHPMIPNHLGNHVEFLRQHYNLISGIRSLPDEVMEIIFYHGLETKPCQTHFPDRHVSLHSLAQTCSRWRNIAISSPRLWSKLPQIRLAPGSTPTRIQYEKEHLMKYLKRSGDHPLTFELRAHAVHGNDGPLVEIFLLLASHCQRWEDVVLELNQSLLDRAPEISGNMPKLCTLRLSLTRIGDDPTGKLETFADCPSLQHASVTFQDDRGSASAGSHFPIELPLSQLRTFDEYVHMNEGRCSIRNPDFLGRVIGWFDSWHLPFLTGALSRHSSITHLDIFFESFDMMGPFMAEGLYFPFLEELSLSFNEGGLSLTFVLELVRRSGCSLKKLAVASGSLNEPGVLSQILALSDNLEDLKFGVIPSEDLQKMRFDHRNPSQVLAPKLNYLGIQFPIIQADEIPGLLDGAALTEMARSRIDVADEHRGLVTKPVVRVRFSRGVTCRDVFHYLEESFLPSEMTKQSTADLEARVRRWETVLQREVKYWVPKTARLRPSHHRAGKALSDVVKEMEEYHIAGSDLVLLQKYGIPLALERGASSPSKFVPCNAKYGTQARIRALLDKWRPFVILEISMFRRWAFESVYSLVYLPSDDMQRSEEEAWDVAKGVRTTFARQYRVLREPSLLSTLSSMN